MHSVQVRKVKMVENILRPENTIKDAVKALDENRVRGVCIVDDAGKILGIFTQGDLRRYILSGGELNESIVAAMNKSPKIFLDTEEPDPDIMCPIVDVQGVLIDIKYNNLNYKPDDTRSDCLKDIPLVIMAGGLGKRLYPLTKVLPKALIPIGDSTITERIIRSFAAWGCREVYLILNHKADMIKAYFDEKNKDYEIHYVQETQFMGTGGGLSLLKDRVKSTFILSNCDILVDADINCILKTHYQNRNVISFVGAYKNISIPYGVIQTDEQGAVTSMQEKPELSFLTNTGVYVIEPSVLKLIPDDKFCHITDIAMKCIAQNQRVGVFPITDEAWLDMGQVEEMKEMIKRLDM